MKVLQLLLGHEGATSSAAMYRCRGLQIVIVVLHGSPVDDGIYQHLDWVAVCQKVDNVKRMPDNSHLQMR